MTITSPHFCPAISIVIPVYNAEKYIGACLKSILNQTFTDFEVIVVDDCSTDGSVGVVESFAEKFDGRLKLFHMKKNSGGPGAPTNKGINFSRGEYIYVMDNDDLLVSNALEIFYRYAEEFGAEVVNTGRVIEFVSENPFPAPESMIVRNWQREIPAEPTFESEDLAARVQKYLNFGIMAQAWSKLVRRDFLIDNGITFSTLKTGQDSLWSTQVYFLAKKFLQIPQALYIYRHRASSITHFNRENGKVNFWNEVVVEGVNFLGDFLKQQKFFQENPQYTFEMLKRFADAHFDQALRGYLNNPAPEVYDKLKSALAEKFGANGDLIAYFCVSAGLAHLNLKLSAQRITELENQLKQIQGS